jgi:hypothetical protein
MYSNGYNWEQDLDEPDWEEFLFGDEYPWGPEADEDAGSIYEALCERYQFDGAGS